MSRDEERTDGTTDGNPVDDQTGNEGNRTDGDGEGFDERGESRSVDGSDESTSTSTGNGSVTSGSGDGSETTGSGDGSETTRSGDGSEIIDSEDGSETTADGDESEDVEATADDTSLEELQEELESRAERINDLEARLKRAQADFQNYKKRQKKRQEQREVAATENLVERLLDVRDNLKRALEQDHDDVEGLREGVKLTLSSFDNVLDAENVSEIDPDPGMDVDPQRHEVLVRIESEQPADTIAEVYQPGYELGEKVLRAAQVTVSDGTENGTKAEERGTGSASEDSAAGNAADDELAGDELTGDESPGDDAGSEAGTGTTENENQVD